jgi:hypothetical protein
MLGINGGNRSGFYLHRIGKCWHITCICWRREGVHIP